MLFQSPDYRTYLKSELLRRIQDNPQYSLRAFARAIGLNHSSLSQVMSGRKRLSETRGYLVAQKLALTKEESDYFVSLIRLNSSTDALYKQKILEDIEERYRGKVLKRYDLSIDEFQVISEWYHFAILQLLELKEADLSPIAIARRFGIHQFEAEGALERLARLKIIENGVSNGGWKRIAPSLEIRSDVSQKAMIEFYRRSLQQAAIALDEQESSTRISGWETLALSDTGFKEARKITYEYLDRLAALARTDRDKAKVYCFLVQAYQLDRPYSKASKPKPKKRRKNP